MSDLYKCPVCDGTGIVSRPPGVPGDVTSWVTSDLGGYDCSVCAGKGVVILGVRRKDDPYAR